MLSQHSVKFNLEDKKTERNKKKINFIYIIKCKNEFVNYISNPVGGISQEDF